MNANIFSKLIKCSICDNNYRHIRERGKSKYICGGYARKISDCERHIESQDDLLYLVKIFCNRNNIELEESKQFMKSIIKQIHINWKDGSIRIEYKNGEVAKTGKDLCV